MCFSWRTHDLSLCDLFTFWIAISLGKIIEMQSSFENCAHAVWLARFSCSWMYTVCTILQLLSWDAAHLLFFIRFLFSSLLANAITWFVFRVNLLLCARAKNAIETDQNVSQKQKTEKFYSSKMMQKKTTNKIKLNSTKQTEEKTKCGAHLVRRTTKVMCNLYNPPAHRNCYSNSQHSLYMYFHSRYSFEMTNQIVTNNRMRNIYVKFKLSPSFYESISFLRISSHLGIQINWRTSSNCNRKFAAPTEKCIFLPTIVWNGAIVHFNRLILNGHSWFLLRKPRLCYEKEIQWQQWLFERKSNGMCIWSRFTMIQTIKCMQCI